MSSQGQRKRLRDDSYYTPPWCVRALVGELEGWDPRTIFDPCAGDGQILDELGRMFPAAVLVANEVRAEELAGLESLVARAPRPGVAIAGDARDILTPESVEGWIVTNPPFKLAGELIPLMIDAVKPGGGVAALLRCSWLYPQKRADIPPPEAVIGLGRRPSFALVCRGGCGELSGWTRHRSGGRCPHCGEGRLERATDSADYAWHVWSGPGSDRSQFWIARGYR